MSFQDHFSAGSAGYARHRPRYPAALFDWLAAAAPARHHALDIATGSGQAAQDLADRFSWVTGFDASEAQLAQAPRLPNLRYEVARAEAIPLPDRCADAIVVAQALHWFDLDRFYAEARRVLRPGGLLVAWTYNLLSVTPAVDALVHGLYHGALRDHWPPARRLVEDGYASLPFPFTPLQAPDCAMSASWDVEQLLGYLRTWSAVGACMAAGLPDPVAAIEAELRAAWGEGERPVQWPLAIRAGTA